MRDPEKSDGNDNAQGTPHPPTVVPLRTTGELAMLASHRSLALCLFGLGASVSADTRAIAQEANLGNSQPRNFSKVIFHNSTLFAASDGPSGVELWRTDGLTAPTRLTDLFPGELGSYPDQIVRRGILGESAYFVAKESNAIGRELYSWNGSTASLVKDLRPAANQGSYPNELTMLPSGLMVFTANDGSARKLWVSDGTALGTIDLTTPSGAEAPYGLTLVGSQILFAAFSPAAGTELWSTQGTPATTVLVRDIEPGTVSSAPSSFALRSGTLFFAASTSANGREVWSSDGTTLGTFLAIDVEPGVGSSDPDLITAGFGPLAFTARDLSLGRQLFRSNLQTTERLTNFARGETIAELRTTIASIFFTVEDPLTGREVWVHDASGLRLLSDLQAGPSGSSPLWLEPIAVGGLGFATGLLWRADDGAIGDELWTSNGSTVGLLANLGAPDVNIPRVGGSSASRIARASAIPPRFVFAARADEGRELFGTDLSSVWSLGDLKPLAPGTRAEPEFHIYHEPGLLNFTLKDAPANEPAILIVSLFQAPSFLTFPFLNGAIQVDLFSGPLLVPFGPTDGAGYASLAVVPPLAPANVPLAAQALVLDTTGPRILVASSIASTSVYACCTPLSACAYVPEESVMDDTGEYSIHLMRNDTTGLPAYYGLIRVARVQQGSLEVEEEILIESHPLDPEADLYLEGVIDLYPPEKTGDLKGDRLRLRLYDQPPTQDTVTQGCELYTSYC